MKFFFAFIFVFLMFAGKLNKSQQFFQCFQPEYFPKAVIEADLEIKSRIQCSDAEPCAAGELRLNDGSCKCERDAKASHFMELPGLIKQLDS